jgi:hypothetical protein
MPIDSQRILHGLHITVFRAGNALDHARILAARGRSVGWVPWSLTEEHEELCFRQFDSTPTPMYDLVFYRTKVRAIHEQPTASGRREK